MKPVGSLTWLPDGVVMDAYEELNLLAHAAMHERKHRQACGGQAECGTCRVEIVSGAFSERPPDERELLLAHPKVFGRHQRLACRARPLGDVVVRLPPKGLRDLRLSRRSH